MDSVEGVSSTKDAEISIFDAEKYFSEECNDSKQQQRQEKPLSSSSLPSPGGHARSLIAESPRSMPSSASSRNSQTALIAKHSTNKRWFAAKKWLFTTNCCCSNAKSVRVKELISNSDRRKPIVVMDSKKSKTTLHADRDGNDDQSQKQIVASEIMSLSRFSITDNVVEIHHVRGTDAPRQQRISATGRPFISGFTFPISDRASTVARDDDVGSDASSDLFEIESFSTQPIVGKDSNGETRFTAASGGNRRLSADADGAGDAELLMDEKSNGMRMRTMICRPENAAVATNCVVGGPPAISLHVGGRPLPARRGRSQSSPLVVAV